jgi:hypothetical protein
MVRGEGLERRVAWKRWLEAMTSRKSHCFSTAQNKHWKKLLYTKNMYTLKLLLNIVTTGTEALVVLGNQFLYASVKEVYRLWAQPHFITFHPLLDVVEVLWSQPILQVGKEVVVTWSEIKTVRGVVKQLLVEMLQQCSRASSCMLMLIFMEEQYTGC